MEGQVNRVGSCHRQKEATSALQAWRHQEGRKNRAESSSDGLGPDLRESGARLHAAAGSLAASTPGRASMPCHPLTGPLRGIRGA